MISDSADDLRAAFSARPIAVEAGEETLEAVWRAVSGEATVEEVQALLARVRAEPAVAEAWRTAREVQGAVESTADVHEDEPSTVVRGPAHWWQGPASVGMGSVVAMAAVAAMYVVPMQQRTGADVAMRADAVRIDNTLLYAGVLQRSDAVLRWSQLEDGTRYTVTVTTDALAPVARAGALEAAEWTIPTDQLAELPAGTVLLWRVEATLPDGSKHRSATFDAVLR